MFETMFDAHPIAVPAGISLLGFLLGWAEIKLTGKREYAYLTWSFFGLSLAGVLVARLIFGI